MDIRTVASWFTSKEPMDGVRIQRLCYFAQCLYIATGDGTPLFENPMQAWIYGPVSPELYEIYNSSVEIKYHQTETPFLPADVEECLENVYLQFKGMSKEKISFIATHQYPWNNARKGVKFGDACTNEISIEDIRKEVHTWNTMSLEA